MDQLKPGLLGTETVRLARITHPDLKALFVTGTANSIWGAELRTWLSGEHIERGEQGGGAVPARCSARDG